LVEKPAYLPETPREILEANLRHLKAEAGEPNWAKAESKPTWRSAEAPGTEAMEMAEMGDHTLYAATTTEETHKHAPKGAPRVSWSIASQKADAIIGGGGASSMEDAKEFAYLAYQAACGVIKGGDA